MCKDTNKHILKTKQQSYYICAVSLGDTSLKKGTAKCDKLYKLYGGKKKNS